MTLVYVKEMNVFIGNYSFGHRHMKRRILRIINLFLNTHNLDFIYKGLYSFSSSSLRERDSNPRTLRFVIGDHRELFFSPFNVVWLNHGVVNTSSSFIWLRFRFSHRTPMRAHEKFYFWVFDFVCGGFCQN